MIFDPLKLFLVSRRKIFLIIESVVTNSEHIAEYHCLAFLEIKIKSLSDHVGPRAQIIPLCHLSVQVSSSSINNRLFYIQIQTFTSNYFILLSCNKKCFKCRRSILLLNIFTRQNFSKTFSSYFTISSVRIYNDARKFHFNKNIVAT